MKKILLSLAVFTCASAAVAQNSAIYKVDDLIKKNQLEAAKAAIDAALANPKTTKKAPFYNKAGEIGARQLQPQLLKASQGIPFDTLAFSKGVDDACINYMKSFDENLLPDAKGRVKVDENIQKDNRAKLFNMISYYNYVAMFEYQNKHIEKAIEYFQKYLDFPKASAFTPAERDSIIAANKTNYAQTRLNLALISYQTKQWDATLAATEEILKDTIGIRDAYLMRMQAYLGKNDSTGYLRTLREGAIKMQDANFTQDLLREYMNRNQIDEAKAIAEDMVVKEPENKMVWYMHGCVNLDLTKNYAAARESFKKALSIDPNFFEANVNMGATYINEVVSRRQKGEYCLDRKKVAKFNADFEKQQKFYADAKPFLEKAKELEPTKIKIWAYPLVVVYENLQMKEKASAMEKMYKEAIGVK